MISALTFLKAALYFSWNEYQGHLSFVLALLGFSRGPLQVGVYSALFIGVHSVFFNFNPKVTEKTTSCKLHIL